MKKRPPLPQKNKPHPPLEDGWDVFSAMLQKWLAPRVLWLRMLGWLLFGLFIVGLFFLQTVHAAEQDPLKNFWRNVSPAFSPAWEKSKQAISNGAKIANPQGTYLWGLYNKTCKPGDGGCASTPVCQTVSIPSSVFNLGEGFQLERSPLGTVLKGLAANPNNMKYREHMASSIGLDTDASTDEIIKYFIQQVKDSNCQAGQQLPPNFAIHLKAGMKALHPTARPDERAGITTIRRLFP